MGHISNSRARDTTLIVEERLWSVCECGRESGKIRVTLFGESSRGIGSISKMPSEHEHENFSKYFLEQVRDG